MGLLRGGVWLDGLVRQTEEKESEEESSESEGRLDAHVVCRFSIYYGNIVSNLLSFFGRMLLPPPDRFK